MISKKNLEIFSMDSYKEDIFNLIVREVLENIESSDSLSDRKRIVRKVFESIASLEGEVLRTVTSILEEAEREQEENVA